MKKLAIISEYNPFHNGHNYIQKKSREITNADIVIAIMSGDFVQRGEISLIDKYKRANSAMLSADLVIEMPSFISLQAANLFARKNIEILNKLEVDYLAFGIENISEKNFLNTCEKIFENENRINIDTKNFLDEGMSFAKASYLASIKYIENKEFFSANNILALEYLRAIKNLKANIEIVPIKRKNSMNKDVELRKDSFSSSTSIRNNIENIKIKDYLPNLSYNYIKEFKNEYNIFPQNDLLYEIFRYKILIEEKNMNDILCYEEGMENYLKKIAKEEIFYKDFIKNSTSQRFTKSRIKRLMINYLLENKTYLNEVDINFIKILAFNENATKLFKECKLNVIMQKKDIEKLNKENKIIFEQMIKASNLYSMVIGRQFDSDYREKISIKKSSY
ncbi:nucleotidyltransferase family protein [Anaerococcus vaginalis]|uniref:nucleotidyltransferase family protein n=1 Tax=Anaerococcus vaginalis TaxID=33037 RepID=UPI002908BA71|nr:nucleotidyltransferase family protein [Anaerococcus vaginalis]MDU5252235.1 nucleotidyltransferase family protein [Anaerococcus vaginalis]MDU6781793.1 nucleotidyltransferase family protein [Anaerococcus vaginalis]